MNAGVDFQYLHGGRDRHVGWYFNLQVDVIFVSGQLFDPQRRVLLERLIETSSKLFNYIWLEVLSSVFSSPDHVVHDLIPAVVE